MKEVEMKSYVNFLESFRNLFTNSIDNIIDCKLLEDPKYENIFRFMSENNKVNFDKIITLLFGFDLNNLEIKDLMTAKPLHRINRDLNKIIDSVIETKTEELKRNNKHYYYSSPFVSVLTAISNFAKNNYFELNNGKIVTTNLIVTSESCCDVEKKLRVSNSSNYDAIMDHDGNIYLAVISHDELMMYMLANSIDMRGGIRIADSMIKNVGRSKSSFDLSSLYKYFKYYTEEKNISKDKFVYLNKRKLRKFCEYIRAAKPHLTKRDIAIVFQNAEGFGYDFVSSSKKNNVDIDYYFAIENLRNVMEVLDELYPDEESINLVDMCNERLKDLNYGII